MPPLDDATRTVNGPAATRTFGGDQSTATTPEEFAPVAAQPEQIGDFRIVRELGRGGMGIVYEAEQLSLARRVALKILPFAVTGDSQQLKRFQIEARAAAALDHPHVVKVFDYGSAGSTHFIAMQFIDGRNLAQIVQERREGRVSAETSADGAADSTAVHSKVRSGAAPLRADVAFARTVAEWGARVAEGLEHAHSFGVVHRDIKPANIMLDRNGTTYLADFGLARLGADGGMTQTGAVMGTPSFMSPEQLEARHGLVGERSDIYSLGATLYVLLTLEPVYSGSVVAIQKQMLLGPPVSPRRRAPALPRDLDTVVMKCLEHDPARRYSSAFELAADLRRFLDGEPIRATPPGLRDRAQKWVRRNSAIAALAFTALLLVFATGAIWAYFAWELKSEREAKLRVEYEAAIGGYDGAIRASADGRKLRELVAAIDRAKEAGVPMTPERTLQLIRALNGLSDGERLSRELNAVDLEPLTSALRGQYELWHATVLFGIDDTRALEFLRLACTRDLPPADRAYAQGLRAETTPDAVEHFREAIRSDWLHQPARVNAALLSMTLGRLDESIALAEESSQLYPEHPEFLAILVNANAMKGDEAAAMKALGRMEGLLPESEIAKHRPLPRLHAAVARALRASAGYGFQFPTDAADAAALDAQFQSGALRSGGAVNSLPPAQRERLLLKKKALDAISHQPGSEWAQSPEEVARFAERAETHPEGSLLFTSAMIQFALPRKGLGPGSSDEEIRAFREAAETAERASKMPCMIPVRDMAGDLALSFYGMLGSPKAMGDKADPELAKRATDLLRSRVGLWGFPIVHQGPYFAIIPLNSGDLILARQVLDNYERRSSDKSGAARVRAQLEFRCEAYPLALKAARQSLRRDPFDGEMLLLWLTARSHLAR